MWRKSTATVRQLVATLSDDHSRCNRLRNDGALCVIGQDDYRQAEQCNIHLIRDTLLDTSNQHYSTQLDVQAKVVPCIIIIIIIFITSAALSKIRRAAGTWNSVLTTRCAFRRRAKVAVDSVDRRSSAGKLFRVSGTETAKFLRPMAVAVHCTLSQRRPTAGVDVQWDERPAGRAQRDTEVLGPADICWPASRSCIVSAKSQCSPRRRSISVTYQFCVYLLGCYSFFVHL